MNDVQRLVTGVAVPDPNWATAHDVLTLDEPNEINQILPILLTEKAYLPSEEATFGFPKRLKLCRSGRERAENLMGEARVGSTTPLTSHPLPGHKATPHQKNCDRGQLLPFYRSGVYLLMRFFSMLLRRLYNYLIYLRKIILFPSIPFFFFFHLRDLLEYFS